jgi:hypothetical protein
VTSVPQRRQLLDPDPDPEPLPDPLPLLDPLPDAVIDSVELLELRKRQTASPSRVLTRAMG